MLSQTSTVQSAAVVVMVGISRFVLIDLIMKMMVVQDDAAMFLVSLIVFVFLSMILEYS